MKKNFCIVILFFLSANIFCQSLPFNPLFDNSKLNSVYININPDSLNSMYDEETNNHEYIAEFIYDDGITKDTVENIGFRLRGNTSLASQKKSFKISFNTYNPGRKFNGMKTINLNGSHNDPSMIREKLYFDVYNQSALPDRRTSFVKLYINDAYYGLYVNLEEYDDIFLKDRFGENTGNLYKCTYPADLKYLGENQSSYKYAGGTGDRAYALQTNTQEDDYSDLVYLISVINNTSPEELPCELEKIFNVDNFLKIYALDISAGNWDNYGFNENNYFLYHNQLTGKFEFLSYDCDNTFGVDWIGIDWATRNLYDWQNSGRPLITQILSVPEYKDRFSYYLNELINTTLSEENIFPHIDSLKELISAAAFDDIYRTLDYGYTYDDFLNSFNTNDIDGHTPYGVKNFISLRNAMSAAQLNVNDINPVIKNPEHFPLLPSPADTIQIKVFAQDENTITSLQIFYSIDSVTFSSEQLYDDGLHNDSTANDNIYGGNLLPMYDAGFIYYYFSALDNGGNISTYPVCETYKIPVGYIPPAIVINEFLAKNTSVIADNYGDFDDYIEIYNKGEFPVFLGDKFLSDELDNYTKFKMPDVTLAPDAYILFWADDETNEGETHCNFKLDGDKDEIGLFSSAKDYFAVIDTISFQNQMDDVSTGRLPNGTGNFTQLIYPSPGYKNDNTVIDTIPQQQIILFNNPSSKTATLQIQLSSPAAVQIKLFAINGAIIKNISDGSFDTGMYDFNINTTSFGSGMYLINVSVNGNPSVLKLMVL